MLRFLDQPRKETTMRMNLKQIVFSLVCVTAMAASAQNPGTATGARSSDATDVTSQGLSSAACANPNLTAADKEECVAREAARSANGSTMNSNGSSMSSNGSAVSSGSTTGSSMDSQAPAPANTPQISGSADKPAGDTTPGPTK
jgi:hypothetical protein